jgi:hypothetical protein
MRRWRFGFRFGLRFDDLWSSWCRRGHVASHGFNVVGGSESVLSLESDQSPVWIRRVIDVQYGIFRERQLLVRLARVIVEGFGFVEGSGL